MIQKLLSLFRYLTEEPITRRGEFLDCIVKDPGLPPIPAPIQVPPVTVKDLNLDWLGIVATIGDWVAPGDIEFSLSCCPATGHFTVYFEARLARFLLKFSTGELTRDALVSLLNGAAQKVIQEDDRMLAESDAAGWPEQDPVERELSAAEAAFLKGLNLEP